MKKLFKIATLVFAMILVTSSVACGGETTVNDGKSHLYVGTVAGGFKSNWIPFL